jgi:hypothetical protein
MGLITALTMPTISATTISVRIRLPLLAVSS